GGISSSSDMIILRQKHDILGNAIDDLDVIEREVALVWENEREILQRKKEERERHVGEFAQKKLLLPSTQLRPPTHSKNNDNNMIQARLEASHNVSVQPKHTRESLSMAPGTHSGIQSLNHLSVSSLLY
ncbi:hypothetical protein ADUPG1_005265, partial [Aduncisulcus paluster]